MSDGLIEESTSGEYLKALLSLRCYISQEHFYISRNILNIGIAFIYLIPGTENVFLFSYFFGVRFCSAIMVYYYVWYLWCPVWCGCSMQESMLQVVV